MDFVTQNMWLIIGAAIVVAILAFVFFRPRQKVRLTDSSPTRPHMAYAGKSESEGRGLAGEAAAAASDVTGEIISAPVHRKLAGGDGPADNLVQLKGVGPKLADTLNGLGYTRFEQIAKLSPIEVERLDAQLGAFKGRLTRDRVIEQADYLSRGDVDGFEQKFGKL